MIMHCNCKCEPKHANKKQELKPQQRHVHSYSFLQVTAIISSSMLRRVIACGFNVMFSNAWLIVLVTSSIPNLGDSGGAKNGHMWALCGLENALGLEFL
jgi:hypothetical protein